MKKYIVSDLHGNGEVYDSIIGFLDNMYKKDDVKLYINGDLIDRGFDSMRMLRDVKSRDEGNGNIEIEYLAGNHELMMWDAYLKRNKETDMINPFCDWLNNGGCFVEGELQEASKDEFHEYYRYISNLKIYNKFSETVNNENILLVHAAAPKEIYDSSHLRLVDYKKDFTIYSSLWTREEEMEFLRNKDKIIGKDGYFTIIGHTPVKEKPGFIYNNRENYLNIDGGCAYYSNGFFDVDHVPLVEIDDNKLNIIIFNHNNQIIDGYIFDKKTYKMNTIEINYYRRFLDSRFDNNGYNNKKLIKELKGIK